MGKLFNFVRVSTPTTGTATTLTIGSASAPFQTPAAAGAVAGDVLTYTIEDGTQREVTFGTVGAGGATITRAATPIYSSTGALLNLSGAAVLSFGPSAADLMNPDLFGTPGAPQAGGVRLGESSLAGIDWPSFRSAQAPERFIQPLFGRTKFYGFQGYQTQMQYIGISSASISASSFSGGAINSTNYCQRQMRSAMVSAATANSIVSLYPNSSRNLFVGNGSGTGGFAASFRFNFADTVSGARAFIGLTGSGTAPTNVNPDTLTNVIGIAQIDGSNNLNLIWAGGTSMAFRSVAPIDLGANFPANTSATDFYELWLFSDPNDASVIRYTVNRWSGATAAISNTVSGTLSNGTPGTTAPAATTGLGPTFWRTNNATAASVQIDVGSFYCWSE